MSTPAENMFTAPAKAEPAMNLMAIMISGLFGIA